MANEKKNVHRYFEVYETMKKAVTDDDNTQTGGNQGGGTTGGELEG